MTLPFPVIPEQTARELIVNGLAGYWELSLRDSISKTPIAHGLQTCVFLAGVWYLVPASALAIKPYGRHGLGPGVDADCCMLNISHDALAALVRAETAKLAKPINPR